MTTGLIAAGLGLAVLGFAGRYAARASKGFSAAFQQQLKSFPNLESMGNGKFYRGGFDLKMSKREAGLILGVSPSANKLKIKEAHRRIMLLNHPDRGGSPYIASKINEAKDYLESGIP